jgi:hypothetical protein
MKKRSRSPSREEKTEKRNRVCESLLTLPSLPSLPTLPLLPSLPSLPTISNCSTLRQVIIPPEEQKIQRDKIIYEFTSFLDSTKRLAPKDWRNDDLKYLMFLYDENFLNNSLENELKRTSTIVNLGYNTECTSTSAAGYCQEKEECIYEIEINKAIFGDIFRHTSYVLGNEEKREFLNSLKNKGQEEDTFTFTVDRLECSDPILCLLLVFEHEIVHLLVKLFCPKITSIHGKTFQTILGNLFGHKGYRHQLHWGSSSS